MKLSHAPHQEIRRGAVVSHRQRQHLSVSKITHQVGAADMNG